MAQVFLCEFCDFSKNPFFQKTPLVAASELIKLKLNKVQNKVRLAIYFFKVTIETLEKGDKCV